MWKKIFFPIGLICIIFILTTYYNAGKDEKPSVEGIFPIDPIFKSFYDRLGGQEVLGPAISPLFIKETINYQYLVAGLMVLNPSLTPEFQYYLAPVGLEFGIFDLPVSPAGEDGVYMNGHIIFPAFQALFEHLGGVETVGQPLTEVRYNQEKNRFEQYFENLGFYQVIGNREGDIDLLTYGVWMCDVHCSFDPPANSRIEIPLRKAAEFVKFVKRLGTDFTGFALTEPYLANDGNLEQIYQNICLNTNPEHPDLISLKPLPELLEVQMEQPGIQTDDPQYYFYPIQGDQGYHIPKRFVDYIKLRGGFKITGSPITQSHQDNGKIFQCFRHVCLEEFQDVFGVMRIRPRPLGYQYRDKYFLDVTSKSAFNPPMELTIQIWESEPLISPRGEQEIGVSVYSGNMPISNVKPELIMTLPDGKIIAYQLPATGNNGDSRIRVNPINGENGTLIPYQVCVTSPRGQKFCVQDSFLIWETSTSEQGNQYSLPDIFQWIIEKLRNLY